jgi:C4-dicarboxylate transporter DctQ subunit
MFKTVARISEKFEESFMALLLAMMTVITFANVVARYIFNANLLWALEATVFLFAWLVLIGMSYCFGKNLHLGVDMVTSRVPLVWRSGMAFGAVLACLLFSLLLLKGSWDYWYPFVTNLAFLETEDIPMPESLQFLASLVNEGERYEKLPRFIPYFALPLGMFLLTCRVVQSGYRLLSGQVHGSDRVSHGPNARSGQ